MTPLTRRHLFTLLTGAAAYAAAPDPVRRYFVIGQPERRFTPQWGPLALVYSSFASQAWRVDVVTQAPTLHIDGSPTVPQWKIKGRRGADEWTYGVVEGVAPPLLLRSAVLGGWFYYSERC